MNVAQVTKVGSILIVEDEPVSLTLLQRLFQADTYRLSAVGTATDALRLLETERFDVGIFDLRVPVTPDDVPSTKAALEILRGARRRQPGMCIITISSVLVDDELRTSLQDLSVKKNFEKPFSFPALQYEVDACLH